MKTLEARVDEKWILNPETGCHEWTANKNNRGYGIIWFNGKMRLAHRVRYFLQYGEIPDNVVIRHKCDNPSCCNPNHLEQGTHKDNMEDMVSRKRQASGSNNGRTKITPEIVLKIRESSKTQDELAKEFGISQSQVGRIKRGIHWK